MLVLGLVDVPDGLGAGVGGFQFWSVADQQGHAGPGDAVDPGYGQLDDQVQQTGDGLFGEEQPGQLGLDLPSIPPSSDSLMTDTRSGGRPATLLV